jgi:hypothetical protein
MAAGPGTTIREALRAYLAETSRRDAGPCVLALDSVSLIRPALCTQRISALGPDKMEAVGRALRATTAC